MTAPMNSAEFERDFEQLSEKVKKSRSKEQKEAKFVELAADSLHIIAFCVCFKNLLVRR